MLNSRASRLYALIAGLFLTFSIVAIDHAEARRGGSFGSRGARTLQAPPATRTVPETAAPIERSMTPNAGTIAASRQPQSGFQRPGFMNGFGGSVMKGLLLGGLIGMVLGQGFGGLAGMLGLLLQVVLIAGAVMLAIRFFRSQSARAHAPAMAGGPSDTSSFQYDEARPRGGSSDRSFNFPGIGSGGAARTPASGSYEISLTQTDLDTFQQLLSDVQEAFGREDHAAMRKLVTPEMVSYLSEELADNAKNGVRNDVSDIALLQADIAESWREGDRDYATAALRYESIDVTRERSSGRVVDGTPDQPSETTELWTFMRQRGSDWQLAAIQEARQ